MNTYLRLTKRIINPNYIEQIYIDTSKYYLYLSGPSLNGGFGTISSCENKITICQEKNPKDFIIMTNWINKIKYIN